MDSTFYDGRLLSLTSKLQFDVRITGAERIHVQQIARSHQIHVQTHVVVVVVVMLLLLFDNILRGSQWLSSHRPVQWQVPLDCCPSFGIDMTANSLIAENKPETDVIGE